ncbi:MAG TPA: hypothetical protein VJ914_35815 [Pseudonocardiaceae bacterium]|nr:hypothetical protein [Pseudonocardiaceae bacterium]
MLAGNPEYPHHVVYRDDIAVVFLSKFPFLWVHLPTERLCLLGLGGR